MGEMGNPILGVRCFHRGIGPTRSLTDMLPIRFASSLLLARWSMGALLLLLLASLLDPLRADRLPPLGVDEFRNLIDVRREPRADADALTEFRRKLRKTAADLPSLAEVSRVLLLSEWSVFELDLETPISLTRVRKAVREASDDAFKRDVQKMLDQKRDQIHDVGREIVREIKREVRLQLLERMEERTRFYLREGRPADRIAASNLIGDTMTTSRRQDVSQYTSKEGKTPVPGVMHSTSRDVAESSKQLRARLRELTPDVRRLSADADVQVQVAALRALSNLEREPAALVGTFKPLLTSKQSNVLTRRAAAEALGRMLEVNTTHMDKSDPEPYLKGVEQVLPVAVLGLADDDAEVRHSSLTACQQAATILDDLANDPLAQTDRRTIFRPAMATVERALPAINRVARDRIPSLRILACRVLESFVLADQKVRHFGDRPLSSPLPEMTPEKNGDKNKKGVARPSSRNGRRAESHPSTWATARSQALPLPPPVPLTSGAAPAAVTLERPVKLDERASAPSIKQTAFQARQPDELPPPAVVEGGLSASLATMIDDLSDKDYRVRLAAVDMLESMRTRAEAAIPALVKALCDSNKFVRWASARTLGRLSPRRANEVVPGLMKLLNDREDASVRITAAAALEQYGPAAKQAVPHLARVINRGDKDYILAILRTIQGIGTEAAPALPNVAWILRDRQQPTSVRVEAALTLGRFGPQAKDHLPLLRQIMIDDADEAVRNAASTAVLGVDRPLK
jgi:HEAT repeat protein